VYHGLGLIWFVFGVIVLTVLGCVCLLHLASRPALAIFKALAPVSPARIELVARIVFAIAVLNFITYALVSLHLGGFALDGYLVNGHYFLRNHGKTTEVSSRVWHYSLIHGVSIFITHPLGIIAGIPAFIRLAKPRPSNSSI
jgi:hypothetical protein